MIFSAAASLVVMLVVLPAVGSGLFGLRNGPFTPVVIVLFHLAYGAMLGAIYGKLIDTDEAHERHMRHLPH